MKISHLAPILAIGLSGCLSTPIKDTKAPSKDIQLAAAVAPQPGKSTDEVDQKLKAFLSNTGLASIPTKAGQGSLLKVAWENKITYAPDPLRGGAPVAGLIARVYLFGSDIKESLSMDGEFYIGLWDNSGGTAQPGLLEVWHIDVENAKKYQRKDFVGDGYTLFLPWNSYHIDLKRVNAVARFNGADGRNLVSSPETLTLDHAATLERVKERLGHAKAEAKADAPAFLPLTGR